MAVRPSVHILHALRRTGLLPKRVHRRCGASALSCPQDAFTFAKYVLGGPWPEGEAVIARSPKCSFFYAKTVLNGRFEAGEDVICNSSDWFKDYFKEVLKGHWPVEMNEHMLKAKALWGNRPS